MDKQKQEIVINFKVDSDFHRKVKVRAAEQGLTLKEYTTKLYEKDLLLII